MENKSIIEEPTVNSEIKTKKNPYKLTTLLLVLVSISLSFVVIFLITKGNGKTNSSNQKNYAIDLSTKAISATEKQEKITINEVKTLTINDVSDSLADKYFEIKEWGLKIKTKYADIIEYEYIKRDSSWKAGETPYAECNGDYLYCDSVVAIRIKENFVDLDKESKKLPYGYTAKDTVDEYKPGLRTIAYIYQDNRSLSQGGVNKARYWEGKTLLFEQSSQGGIDDLGNSLCGVDLSLKFETTTPCEDILLSLYRFNASKI